MNARNGTGRGGGRGEGGLRGRKNWEGTEGGIDEIVDFPFFRSLWRFENLWGEEEGGGGGGGGGGNEGDFQTGNNIYLEDEEEVCTHDISVRSVTDEKEREREKGKGR